MRESSFDDDTYVVMNEGPADLDLFKSTFFPTVANFTSCLAQLFDLLGPPVKCVTIFSVEFVRDDFLLGGAGGTTGTYDFTVFGNGPNMSNGREMFVIG